MKNIKRTNPVAKYGNRLNRPATHRDKTKYTRKDTSMCEYCDIPMKECTGYKCWIR